MCWVESHFVRELRGHGERLERDLKWHGEDLKLGGVRLGDAASGLSMERKQGEEKAELVTFGFASLGASENGNAKK